MAQFVIGQDTEVKSDESTLEVSLDGGNPLKPGQYVFKLVVVDDADNASDPASVTVIVVDRERPTAVLEVVNARRERLRGPTVQIPFGERFLLTGDKSTDIGGQIKTYVWTLAQ